MDASALLLTDNSPLPLALAKTVATLPAADTLAHL